MTTSPVCLETSRVSKSFNGVCVLNEVSLQLRRGEILGLVGQNGSGKSTLIKILSGFHAPDPGSAVFMGGKDVSAILGSSAQRTGMAFIHQDLALVASMTILENLRIARFRTGLAGRIKWAEERARVRVFLDQVGLDVDPRTKVADLSVTEQALVAIARGLADTEESESEVADRLLVLDEPTAYLPHAGVERLFGVLRTIASHGTSILFVSHRLDEVRSLCDRVAVLRGGELVATVNAAEHSEKDILELMLGRRVEELYPDTEEAQGDPALHVEGLVGRLLKELSFEARAGEIVGFAGLPGSGYEEVPYLLTGGLPATAGRVSVNGEVIDARKLDPGAAIRKGIVLLPADRKATGGVPSLRVGENMTLPTVHLVSALRSLILHKRERSVVERETHRFQIQPRNAGLPLGSLSGGNQQKVLLAKWMLSTPSVLALHEPTQGVDVGAKRDVFAHLAKAAEDGAIVLISTVEHEDLAHLCHRVYVLRNGVLFRTIQRPELEPHRLAEAVFAG